MEHEVSARLALKEKWQKILDEMIACTQKANGTWLLDFKKDCNTRKAELLRVLEFRLSCLKVSLECMTGSDETTLATLSALKQCLHAAYEARECWQKRTGGKYTKDELAAEHALFTKRYNYFVECIKKLQTDSVLE